MNKLNDTKIDSINLGVICVCGNDHGEHDHGEHDHGENDHSEHDHSKNASFATACTCGNDHDKHDHSEHDHGKHDHGENASSATACTCGNDHSDHDHGEHDHGENASSATACTCGSEHSHSKHDHDHSCGCELCEMSGEHGDDCSCGHDHDHGPFETKEKVLLGGAILIFIVSFLVPMPSFIKIAAMAAATIIAGYPVFKDGIKSILKFSFDETALLTIAVLAAFAIGEYSEAVIVTLFFRMGNILENIAVSKSRRDIENLTKIKEENTNVIADDGKVVSMPSKNISIKTKIAIKPGEKVPIDSIVLEGNSLVDTSALTGESLSRPVAKGDTLLSGMINIDGMLICETVNTFDDSAASKIIELVKDSMTKKGKTEHLISRFSKIYTPFVIVSAALLAFLPPILGFGTFTMWISRALVFLVASCPCALVISIPLSFFAGIGANSKEGVLVKGSKYIEIISKADCIVFDKTGTLTTGKLSVNTVKSCSDYSTDDIARIAAIAESYSNHPMAEAVTANYPEIDLSQVTNFSEITGKGVSLNIGKDAILCGSHKLMDDFKINVSNLPSANIYLSINGIVSGYIILSDTPRSDAKATIKQLKSLGISKTVMLTGDNIATAEKIKELCGVDVVYADLLPQDKVSHLEEIKKTSGITLFVGDGINDAPVLAMADAGVAMGLGTDAAIEAADIVLLSDNLSSLAKAVAISRRTLSIAKFNIIFALSVKAVVLVLGALGLAAMWMAILADVGVSVLSVLNATRILKPKN